LPPCAVSLDPDVDAPASEVLERVIKVRYKSLSENFAKINESFEKLARESIKEKKKKKKITKDYNNLWWLAKHLKRKIKKLKAKITTHPDLQVLAQVAVNLLKYSRLQKVEKTSLIWCGTFVKHFACFCI
jgi:hypothetical protein